MGAKEHTNPGLASFFNTLVFMTGWSGGKMRGEQQTTPSGPPKPYNLEFTGPGGSTWHTLMAMGSAQFFKGHHPSAEGTLKATVEDFYRVLSDEISFSEASSSKALDFSGDQVLPFAMMFMVESFKGYPKRKGFLPFIARLLTKRLLRKYKKGLMKAKANA